tara:strand:+ start:1109 stop:1867 length:759 start_codon:yes stop_codon:yes gene_type:complete
MKLLRELITEFLKEDYAAFVSRSGEHNHREPSSGRRPGEAELSTFHRPEDAEPKRHARALKTIWKEEADHAFFDSLTKVHWFTWRRINKSSVGRAATPGRHKDEISVVLYAPGEIVSSSWGTVGIEIKGRTTYASNNMDDLYTGYSNLPPKLRAKYKSSGVPKRGRMSNDRSHMSTILDKGSFKGATDSWNTNEGIIANWTPVAIRIGPAFFQDSYIPAQAAAVDKKLAMLAELGLPIYNELGDVVATDPWT